MTRPAILLADDDETFRTSFAEMLEGEKFLVTQAACADEVTARLQERDFDLVILDLYMPGSQRLSLADHILCTYRDLPVWVITGEPCVETAVEALRNGVQDYIVKPFDFTQVRRKLDGLVRRRQILDGLTGRQQQVFALLVEGFDPQRISFQLGISLNTTRNHVKAIYRKLNVSSHVELVMTYWRQLRFQDGPPAPDGTGEDGA